MKMIAIAFPLTILIDCIAFINMFMWQQQSVYEFEQRQLDLQVNYSVDAAVQEMLANSTHLGTDYAKWGEMVIEPELALDTYISVLLRNLGWSDTGQNRRDLIETSMPFFCVATYDGYYMYMRQHEEVEQTLHSGAKVNNTVYEMRWTPKLPYSETLEDPAQAGSYIYYFYNLSDSEYGTYTERTNTLKYNNVLSHTSDGPGSSGRAWDVINDTLTKACNSAMFTGLEGKVDMQWYIPSTFSEWSNSNPVRSPSVLTYMSRSDQGVQYDTVTFGIGGAKIDDAEFCICYIGAHGVPCYTWADLRSQVEAKGYSIISVTTSPKEAAEKGYYFDFSMTR